MRELNGIHLGMLRSVEAVARLGSLRIAADELGVTPGAVSQQIIKAEAQLDRQLFERLPKGLVPTAIGHQLAEHLNDGFRELAKGITAMRPNATDAITISVAPVFAGKWLVWRLSRFSAEHPSIRVRIDASVDVIDPRANAVDACIRVGWGDWPNVHAEKLFDQRVFPVCAPSLADTIVAPSDLTKVPIIHESTSMFGWEVWLGPNDMQASQLGDGPMYSDASLCLDAAIAGQGVFLAWETLAHDALMAKRLVAPLPGRFRTGIAYWFVEPERALRSPQVEAFRNWLLKELAQARS
ncbi:MAG: LysR substrate-binding domain-containing protein [Ascidiaceihabitans sp.]|nr:LysR substrate-binding domain-containing protein [Ascidiaceihabitans sp.]